MRPELTARIRHLLPDDSSPPGQLRPELGLLYRMMREYPFRGGKGIRSELMLLSAQAHGVQEGTPAWDAALWVAATIELFQNWVLIHDDIADDSEERRGRAALHREYGVPLALNAGDALHAYMWAALLESGVTSAYPEILGMVHRTAEGQHIDLAWVEERQWALTPADYLEMVRLKTGYYTVVVPLRLGAIVAGRAPDARFEPAGLLLGAAFQIRDDVLNLMADPAEYGKEIGGDLLEGKRTLIVLHWLNAASEEQRRVFLDEMNRSRGEKRPETVARLLTWLLESGSLAYAQQVADEQATEGLALLKEALEELPNQGAAKMILTVAETLARRQA